MMRIFCTLFFASFLVAALFAQNNEASDSLLTQKYIAKAGKFHLENVDSCIIYTEKIVHLKRNNEQWNEAVFWANVISKLSYANEHYTTLEKYTAIALNDSEAHLEKGNQNRVDAMNNMSMFYKMSGNYNQSILLYKKSINDQKIGGSFNSSLIGLYQNISVAYRGLGDYDEAITYLNEALLLQLDSIKEEGKLPLAKTYLDLALLNRDKQLYKQAKSYHYRSEKILNTIDLNEHSSANDYLILSHQSLSRIYLSEQKVDSSLFHIQKALHFHSEEFQSREITSQDILGDVYLYQKKFHKAIETYRLTNHLAIKHFASFDKKDIIARTFKKIAIGYLNSSNFDNALKNYQAALIALSPGFESTDIKTNPSIDQMLSKLEGLEIMAGKSETFLKKYELEKKTADLQAAFNNYQFASAIIHELRKSFLGAGSKNVLAKKSLSVYEGGIKAAFLLFQQSNEDKYLEAAWDFAELNKARLLEESLQENYALLTGGLPLEELGKEQNLRREINFYENKINQEKGKTLNQQQEKLKIWNSAFFELNNQYNKLIEHFENKYPIYYALKYEIKNKSLEKIRANILGNQNALLEYFIGEENSYLFCVTKNDLQIFELKKHSSFSDDITTIRSIISTSPFESMQQFESNRVQFVGLSHQLYQQLLAPALHTLPKEITSLIIVPDDILAYLPFELLLTENVKNREMDYSTNSCSYLFKKYALSYNYSASLLADHSEWKQQPNLIPFLGFAPSFEEEKAIASRVCTEDKVYSLQCNDQEVNAIYDQLGGKTIMGTSANIAAFENQAQQCRILHLATHACIDEENPDFNKIYFSDNYVNGNNLGNLKLNAELAVLSACNTGSGKLIKGEGVMSLSRGFILAGCPSTLMSLWSVDDCTTSEIMVRFYKNIKAGMTKDEALRQSKLAHLASADKVNSHPYYWAAFVQSGNAEAMEFPSSFSKYYLFLLLPLIFVLFFYFKK